MDAIEVLKTRRSVRTYKTEPVPRKIIEDLIDCGHLAATAVNIQPWEFVVVTKPEMLRRIAETTDHGKFIANVPVCVVVLCQDTKYYLEDGSAATENILLAARAHGLGSCWVAGDRKPYASDICRLVGAPRGYKLISLIPIGYPAETPEQTKRPLSDVLHWEKY
ncbi:MAG TPA: nitroreductase family protein [Terriglobia bacterium]|nr:nitroreductase family protein [Terriglobia bacterium]